MRSEHRTSCCYSPNFARQTRCGAGTDHMTSVTYMNIIHIELMLLKKIKCVKNYCLTSIQPQFWSPVLKKKCKILLSKKV